MSAGARCIRRTLPMVVLAVVTLGAVPAWADHDSPLVDTRSGKTGAHSLPDSADAPGGTCFYGIVINGSYANYLDRIRVRRPMVFARKDRKTQRIAMRVRAEGWNGSAWQAHLIGGWVSRTATPKQAAPFTARRVRFDTWFAPFVRYRARVDLRWFAPDGKKVVGRASLYPRHYSGEEEGNPPFLARDDCGITTG